MKKLLVSLLFLSLYSIISLSAQEEKQIKVLISTDLGNMTAVLYNETPKHRDNFVKLVNEGWFDNSPFHRV
ncbi:MAG: peptidylprolyl isomerase, partial [Bacteroidales bacterium]|nr:peptidylprolyl isomerase [Bacteroidales bacterium]